MFELHPNLNKKIHLLDLTLCRVLLEDEKHYPWLILVPRRTNVCKIMDLSNQDKHQLMDELDLSQKVLFELFHPAQLNVAAIGNKTPQLHIHVIARTLDDPAWPNTVWDHPVKAPYSSKEKEDMVAVILEKFGKFSLSNQKT